MKLKNTTTWSKLAALLPAAFLASALSAGTVDISKSTKDVVAPCEESIYEKIWNLAKLYKNDNNPIIEEIDFTGRFQLDYFNVDSSRGNNDFTEIRRFRFGLDTFWLDRHLELKAELDTNLRSYNADELFYRRFTDLFANIKVNDALNFKVGKAQARYGYDRSFSDTLLLTFERSNNDELVYNGNDYHSLASIFGKSGNWFYQVTAVSLDVDKEFGQFNGGQAYLANLSYDFSKSLGVKKALASIDYFHSDPNKNSDVFKNYKNGVTAYFDYKKGPWGLVGQVGWLDGITDAPTSGDVYQALAQTSYDITEKLQAVFRYELGLAENDNGLALASRQEKTVGSFVGDKLNTFYVGLNYYLWERGDGCKTDDKDRHKLKLMAGEQYTDLGGGTGAKAGFDGWTTIVGIRMYW